MTTPEDKARYAKYKKSWIGRYEHVACPLCILKNGLRGIYPTYFKCSKCGWVQLNCKECYMCEVEDKNLEHKKLEGVKQCSSLIQFQ